MNHQKTLANCLFAILLAFNFLIACSPILENNTASISFTDLSQSIEKVEIISFNELSLEPIKLGSFSFDSVQNGSIELEINEPLFVVLKLNATWLPMYLAPGFVLDALITNSEHPSIQFTGEGAEVNNYLITTQTILDGFDDVFQLEVQPFLSKMDVLQDSLFSFHQSYLDTIPMAAHHVSILEKRNQILKLNTKQSYAFSYAVRNNFNLPDELQLDSQILYDSEILNLGMKEYYELLHVAVHLKYLIPVIPTTSKFKEKSFYIADQINTSDFSSEIKSYLLAKNTDYWLGFGLDTTTQRLYDDYYSQFPKSIHFETLDNHMEKWLALSSGRPAADIVGETIDGEVFSLEQLNGNVVYIDIWALWCKPCIAEIPFSKALMNRFDPNDKIKFLNISVDRDKSAWQKKVSNEKNWNGIHINTKTDNLQFYQVNSYPRYMIIDKNGNIFDSDAARPSSSDTLYNQLRRLL